MDDLFEADLSLTLRTGQTGVFGGQLQRSSDQDNVHQESWRTLYPVPTLELYWGTFERLPIHRSSYEIAFYHLPSHEYQARVFLEEMKELYDGGYCPK